MKTSRLLRGSWRLTGVVALAVVSGFVLRDVVPRASRSLGAAAVPESDFFARAHSFSEIEMTRAELEGLALRFRTQTRLKQLDTLNSDSASAAKRAEAIAELERGIVEFKETPEELVLVQDLLLLLRAQGDYGRWLDVYLDVLYRRPTQELLNSFFDTAQRLSRETHRESEMLAAFEHLRSIPLDFPFKRRLQDLEAHAALTESGSARGRLL